MRQYPQWYLGWPKQATAVRLMVQPELQSTELNADGPINAHPFCFIQLNDCEHRRDSKGRFDRCRANAEIVQREVSYFRSCSRYMLRSAAVKLPDTSSTFVVSVPFIVNTRAVEAGNELILRRVPPSNPHPCDRSRSNTEVDQIMMEDNRKRQRTD